MQLSDFHAPAWMDDGLCTQIGVEMFFPDDDKTPTRERYKQAKLICSKCTEEEICLETFLEEPYGVFGNMTPAQRLALRKRRKKEELELERLKIEKQLKIKSKGKNPDVKKPNKKKIAIKPKSKKKAIKKKSK